MLRSWCTQRAKIKMCPGHSICFNTMPSENDVNTALRTLHDVLLENPGVYIRPSSRQEGCAGRCRSRVWSIPTPPPTPARDGNEGKSVSLWVCQVNGQWQPCRDVVVLSEIRDSVIRWASTSLGLQEVDSERKWTGHTPLSGRWSSHSILCLASGLLPCLCVF